MDIFCESTDGSLGRGTVCMEGKSVYRVNVNSSKSKTLPPPKYKWFSAINLPPGSWLTSLKNDAILEIQYWSLLLADWHSTMLYSLGEWKSMLVSPWKTSTPATLALCSWVHWVMTGMDRERDWLIIPATLLYLSSWSHPLVNTHMGHNYVQFLTHS